MKGMNHIHLNHGTIMAAVEEYLNSRSLPAGYVTVKEVQHEGSMSRVKVVAQEIIEGKSDAEAYEELREIIDGASESMTHEDAVHELKRAMAAYNPEVSNGG